MTKMKIKELFKGHNKLDEIQSCDICNAKSKIGELYLSDRNKTFALLCNKCSELNETEREI